jgi:hypothetical protein
VALQARLVAEGEKALDELREQVDMEILAQKFLRSVVKRECWDSMAAAGRTLFELARFFSFFLKLLLTDRFCLLAGLRLKRSSRS